MNTADSNAHIADRLELAAKIIREKLEFEVKTPGFERWVHAIDVLAYLDTNDWELRVKPTPAPPRMVPLTASDIPPGTFLRSAESREWWVITQVKGGTVSTTSGASNFDELFEDPDCLMLRPGETEWHPFAKLAEEPTS